MTDGSDVESTLSSLHDENSNRDLTQEEIMHVEFDEEHWSLSNLEETYSNQIHILSTGPDDSINDNTNKNNENNKNNKDINSDNHFQINQNTINKKRKRNIISEEKKKKMGRKKKGFCSVSKHNKYSEDNQIKKMKTNFTNFCYSHVKKYYKKKIKKIIREFVINGNKDYNLKLLPSSIEDYLSNEISIKYTKNRGSNKKKINILKKKCPELKDFLEQTFNDGLKKYINGYYDSFYKNPTDNKYLFCQLKIDEKEKEIWERLINGDLYKYFLKKKGRKTIDKEN